MTTTVDIVNRALLAIASRGEVANMEERSQEARLARILYPPTRDALLRAAPWGFAKRTGYLSLRKSAPGTPTGVPSASAWDARTMPTQPWLYEYAVPPDCVMVRWVSPTAGASDTYAGTIFSVALPSPTGAGVAKVRFELGVSTDASGSQVAAINTNAATATCCYTARVENENLWDAGFQEAMVASLASQFAGPITGKDQTKRYMAQQAMQAVESAKAQNGNEGVTIIDHVPDWLTTRGIANSTTAQDFISGYVTPSFLVF